MRILITNDDGITAPVLPIFAQWARKLGEVTVVAPKVEQSGKSHAIDFTRLIEIKPYDLGEGIEAYSMDSTPADCVRYAVLGMKREYDLILSGINRGFNLGKDIPYSGTAGAIFEAGRLGIPGIALSTEPTGFHEAVDRLDELLDFFNKHELLKECSLYNVNIPFGYKEIKVTRQGGIYFTDDFVRREGDMFEQVGAMLKSDGKDFSLDTDAVRHGYVSIMPMTIEKTDVSAFDRINRKL